MLNGAESSEKHGNISCGVLSSGTKNYVGRFLAKNERIQNRF